MSRKTCQACGYVPEPEQEIDPSAPKENCPACGGIETVTDENASDAQDESSNCIWRRHRFDRAQSR